MPPTPSTQPARPGFQLCCFCKHGLGSCFPHPCSQVRPASWRHGPLQGQGPGRGGSCPLPPSRKALGLGTERAQSGQKKNMRGISEVLREPRPWMLAALCPALSPAHRPLPRITAAMALPAPPPRRPLGRPIKCADGVLLASVSPPEGTGTSTREGTSSPHPPQVSGGREGGRCVRQNNAPSPWPHPNLWNL